MSKKSIIVVVLLLLILVVVGVGSLLFNDREICTLPAEPTQGPIVTKEPAPTTPTPTPTVTPEPTQKPQKEFTYYWNPQYNFEEKDYVSSDNMLGIQNNGDTMGIVPEKYYVTESSNIVDAKDIGYGELELTSIEGDSIIVSELDPTECTIQQLRISYLEDMGFRAYLAAEPLGIPVNSKLSEKDGLDEWWLYIDNRNMPSRVDKCGEDLFLVTDDIIRTSYGNAMFIVLYNSTQDFYNAMAYITNDTGMRIIKVNMVNIEDYSKCTSYLYEITDEVVHLIK